MNALQPMHLVVIGVIALLVFGPKKLPELARGIGEAMKEFKKTMNAHDEPEVSAPVVAQVSAAPEAPAPTVKEGSAATTGTPQT
jgi:sec-independent protein translocase protein TatA